MKIVSRIALTTLIAGVAWMPARAQAAPTVAKESPTKEAATLFNHWLSEPTPIVLSADQKPHVDSLRQAFVKEQVAATSETGDGGARMQAVMKTRALAKKYQAAVRAILTPEQQAQLDKNLEAQKGPGGRGSM